MSKINAAESIRGLACLAVVFSHLAMSFFPYLHHFDPKDQADPNWVSWVHHSPFAFVYSGDAAVFVFFVLSGYVLSYALLKNPQQFSAKLSDCSLIFPYRVFSIFFRYPIPASDLRTASLHSPKNCLPATRDLHRRDKNDKLHG